MISLTLFICFIGVILSAFALIYGVKNIDKKDKDQARYIARLEQENRRLKYTVSLMERKAKGDRLVYTLGADNK